jgi:hypothetical protein
MIVALRMRVFFMDEAPRIGSGWRIVSVMNGRKWVRLACEAGRAKFTKEQWAPIARHGHELPPRKRKRRAKKGKIQ